MRQLIKRRVGKMIRAHRDRAIAIPDESFRFLRSIFYERRKTVLSPKQEKWVENLWDQFAEDVKNAEELRKLSLEERMAKGAGNYF